MINQCADPTDLTQILLQNENDSIYDFNPIELKPSNYYEVENFAGILNDNQNKNYLSLLSLNIRSINSKFDQLVNFLSEMPAKFSIIGLQEVWSVSRQFPLQGYQPIEFNTRDKNAIPNPNCGGGWGHLLPTT